MAERPPSSYRPGGKSLAAEIWAAQVLRMGGSVVYFGRDGRLMERSPDGVTKEAAPAVELVHDSEPRPKSAQSSNGLC